jgi:inosine-uridine nucleoside N-ribohydrolase
LVASVAGAAEPPRLVIFDNDFFDPEAAEIVLAADWPKITSVGDVTNDTMFSDELVQRIARTKAPLKTTNAFWNRGVMSEAFMEAKRMTDDK